MDYTVHGVAKSQTQLNDFHSLTHLEPEELGMDGVNLRVSQVARW